MKKRVYTFIISALLIFGASGGYKYDIAATAQKENYVIPSGKVIGIKMYIDGLLVVGLSDIPNGYGYTSPGKDAGIKEGDLIIEIDGVKVTDGDTLTKKVQEKNGAPVSLNLVRGDASFEKDVTPVFYSESKDYKLGLWIKESEAGIGTMTFSVKDEKTFAALGHGVSNSETGVMLDIGKGNITDCKVVGITKGEKGVPGEIKGEFEDGDTGDITKNGDEGICGLLYNQSEGNEIQVANVNEVCVGKATIYSGVSGEIKEYDIEIKKASGFSGRTKGMVVKITDPELLNLTGGIVQGMSGSPIIQNGKLVGAISHVFVNDPTCGYGMFAEYMLDAIKKGNNF